MGRLINRERSLRNVEISKEEANPEETKEACASVQQADSDGVSRNAYTVGG